MKSAFRSRCGVPYIGKTDNYLSILPHMLSRPYLAATKVHKAVREKEGRAAEPTAMIIDCQSVKSAEGGEAIGYDGGN